MGWWKESIAIVKALDPAARSSLEVILTYPGHQSFGCPPPIALFVAAPF